MKIALAVHIAAGGVAVATGAVAALAAKRSGRHPRAGRGYLWALGVLFATALVLAVPRWPGDAHLVALGAAALTAGFLGFVARRRRRRGWARWHICGIGASYALMLTAFYVDNGPRLPLWKLLPDWAFWVLPGAVAAPVVVRALRRHGAWRRNGAPSRSGTGVRPPGRGARSTGGPRAP